MRSRPNPAEALVLLPRFSSSSERRACWRQAITALGRSVRAHEPPPLDGVTVETLECAVDVALATGLADDLDWIASGAAAVALYEITLALPPGRARRELGRRVFARLYEGTAATFAAVGARMALSSARPLDAPTLRARISLIFDLPIATSVNTDAFALTLILRRELRQRWVLDACTGAMPARRLAAKLFEHAAREALLRAQQGDHYPHAQLLSHAIQPSFRALLGDREPLVWRHAAVARGLLAGVDSSLREEIDLALDPSLSPTEWRRAAVSLAACTAVDPENALKQCRSIIFGKLSKLDPGLAATMVLGLPRAIEAEPDAAEELLTLLSTTRRPDVAETAANLLSDINHPNFAAKAVRNFREVLLERARGEGSVLRGVAARALRILSRDHDGENDVLEGVRRAVVAFETTGARAAYELALTAAENAHRAMDFVASHDPHDAAAFSEILSVLADLDASALERSRLPNLLLLGRKPGDVEGGVPQIERLYDRLGNWVLDGEQHSSERPWSRDNALANQRRLRALLHLIDLDTTRGDQEALGLRSRVQRTIQVLLTRLASGPDALIHRIACAALARSYDAALREGLFEASDMLLTTAMQITQLRSLETIADASTTPEVASAISAWARFVAGPPNDADAPVPAQSNSRLAQSAERVVALSRGLSSGAYRAEALREAVLRLGRSLEMIASARGLNELVGTAQVSPNPILEVERTTDALRTLIFSAQRRVLTSVPSAEAVPEALPVSQLVERAVRAGGFDEPPLLPAAIAATIQGLPPALAATVAEVLARLQETPITAKTDLFAIPLERRRTALPDWLLPRRTIGAFYVVRALGTGGVSSVFVARRIEERKDANAESFALKVPEYDPTTARSVSEQQFLDLFKDEAGALLSMPHHPNLARFVTFDLAARPKPILVMELITGAGLDRLINSRALTTEKALNYLDGILAGLEAMHRVGIGHLDVKPSNVILRDGNIPVLVDFGLSGRKLRLGCGTLEYCAPEVLGVAPKGATPRPMPADIYAFACLAFELLTAEPLFSAEDETALVSLHVTHDGAPSKLQELNKIPGLGRIVTVLSSCLRRDPELRPSASAVREALSTASTQPRSCGWPIELERRSASA